MVLYTDGGCSGNGQKDIRKRRMVMVVTAEDGEVVSQTTADGGSNNVAELLAIRDAFRWAIDQQAEHVEIRTDSKIGIGWVYRQPKSWQIDDPVRVKATQDDIGQYRLAIKHRLVWVPRDENLAGHVIEAQQMPARHFQPLWWKV